MQTWPRGEGAGAATLLWQWACSLEVGAGVLQFPLLAPREARALWSLAATGWSRGEETAGDPRRGLRAGGAASRILPLSAGGTRNCSFEDQGGGSPSQKPSRKMPEREDDFLTPATRMLEKRREMAEVEQALIAQKEEFQMKMESIQQRREELEHKEEQLKDSIFKFDRFLKENDSKRNRAMRKANEERQLTGQKEKEAVRLQLEIAHLAEQKEGLQQRMGRNAVFQKYLERVLEKSEEFQEVREMIDRFNTLVATQANLLRREIVNQEAMERERAALYKYVEDKHSEILQDNNELAQLQSGLEAARSNLIQLESNWTHIQNTAAQKTLTIGLVKMATYNLFQILNKQLRLQVDIPMEDTEGQLDKIQISLGDLSDIFADLRKAEISSRQALSTAN